MGGWADGRTAKAAALAALVLLSAHLPIRLAALADLVRAIAESW